MMQLVRLLTRFILICLSVILFFEYASCKEENDFSSVTGPCAISFPKDHGDHPDYRTEWWYYTGNLQAQTDSRYGFQLTFFRTRISPPSLRRNWPDKPSSWRTQHLYMAHVAISDLANERYFRADKAARNAMGMSGVSPAPETVTVYLHDWRTRISPETHRLHAKTDDFSFNLQLKPLKAPVLHGENGYSRKGSAADRASCYYSFTRLDTRGVLTVKGEKIVVQGLGWMDHEYSSAPLEPGIVGWDWFSLQLDDQTEIMIYQLRKKDGRPHPSSSGTYIDPDGRKKHLTGKEFQLSPTGTWQSPHTGAEYPSQWTVRIPPLSMTLTVESNLADQEMQSPESTNITYWEGSVSVDGQKGKDRIKGHGYVEMTGYAKPFDAPL
jgi:predicted secreted hydrolase